MAAAYSKPYLPISAQLDLLKSRGMIISDETKAAECLERIGYYRLSGYWYPYRRRASRDGKPVIEDQFKNDARFSDVIDLYVFDKKLRMLMLDAVERLEVALRVEIALLLGKRDAWAHLHPANLAPKFVRTLKEPTYASWAKKFNEAETKSREEFVFAFRRKYSGRLPIWMAIELWDFGTLSIFLSGMNDGDLNHLAKKFGLPRRELLTSWIRSVNYVRNVSAHHGRLWNRNIIDQPKPPKRGELPGLDHLAESRLAQTRLYAIAVALRWLLRTVNPSTSWPARLKEHFATFPNNPHFDPKQSGFPRGWESLPFWR